MTLAIPAGMDAALKHYYDTGLGFKPIAGGFVALGTVEVAQYTKPIEAVLTAFFTSLNDSRGGKDVIRVCHSSVASESKMVIAAHYTYWDDIPAIINACLLSGLTVTLATRDSIVFRQFERFSQTSLQYKRAVVRRFDPSKYATAAEQEQSEFELVIGAVMYDEREVASKLLTEPAMAPLIDVWRANKVLWPLLTSVPPRFMTLSPSAGTLEELVAAAMAIDWMFPRFSKDRRAVLYVWCIVYMDIEVSTLVAGVDTLGHSDLVSLIGILATDPSARFYRLMRAGRNATQKARDYAQAGVGTIFDNPRHWANAID